MVNFNLCPFKQCNLGERGRRLLFVISCSTYLASRDSMLFKPCFYFPHPLPAAWNPLFDAIQHKGPYLAPVGPIGAVRCHPDHHKAKLCVSPSLAHRWPSRKSGRGYGQACCPSILPMLCVWARRTGGSTGKNAEEVGTKAAEDAMQPKWNVTQWHVILGS